MCRMSHILIVQFLEGTIIIVIKHITSKFYLQFLVNMNSICPHYGLSSFTFPNGV